MNSLRARIAALLVAAIFTVVGLATFAASRVLQPPQPEATMEPIARQLQVLARLAQDMPETVTAAGGRLQAEPAEGHLNQRLTQFLTRAMLHTGEGFEARVTQRRDAAAPTASVLLADGRWLLADIPDFSPPDDRWLILTTWIGVIVLGSVLVGLYAAQRLTRPLQILENAAGRIGADGTLPVIPETGTGEVRATARALNRLSEQLRVAMESRMRLVAAAGHDLRTPMTRMRLRAEFIEDDLERAKWLADLEELDLIADSAIRLVREEASRDATEVLQLNSLLHDVVTGLQEAGYPLRLGTLEPLSVKAGRLAMTRALRNLLVNAATHGGGAEVSLAMQQGTAVVSIHDQGPGIPEALIGQVFEPFFRVDPARRKTVPGAGLGLAIAREITERFGGRIEISNQQPQGLLQQVFLPLA